MKSGDAARVRSLLESALASPKPAGGRAPMKNESICERSRLGKRRLIWVMVKIDPGAAELSVYDGPSPPPLASIGD
ncbi:hypothetical protein [Bradyrhizobium cosmicum]|uniref:hypothetical protein n=1 Tax=Bradyrhizobium cosmicum TaxID=1404864 RepID=UPI0028EDCD0A|nr:hypothetical protein [Bradyrhizobium cosmicum]